METAFIIHIKKVEDRKGRVFDKIKDLSTIVLLYQPIRREANIEGVTIWGLHLLAKYS